MTTAHKHSHDVVYFRAARSRTDRVDRDNRVIYGVAIVEQGDIRFDSRKLFADYKTLDQVLALAQKSHGVVARLGHPQNDRDEVLEHVGRFRNFRVVGKAVVADLHVAASSKHGDYVLDLAAEDPGAFGASMVTVPDNLAHRERRADGKQPIRVAQLLSIDLVGVPALTSGLLASEFASNGGAADAFAWMRGGSVTDLTVDGELATD